MNEDEEIRFIDLFSGIGGFRLGLERSNQEGREYLSKHGRAGINHFRYGNSPSRNFEKEGGRKSWSPSSHKRLKRVNSGLGTKLTAGKGGYQNQKGLCADSGSKDGNGRRKHTDDNRGFGLRKANTWMEKDGVEYCTAPRNCTKSQTLSTSKEERTGYFRCVWSCDNNKYANQVYTKQFGEAHHHSGDIRGVDPGDIPDFDLLCAGFPCQAFSVAGKRKGFQDTRGTLFFEICRIAEAKKPSLLLLENVKGLLSSGRGQVFYTIIQSLEDLGYWVEWQVLNSKYFGVPQNRERVFIIGHLRGTGGREIFPIGETDEMAKGEGRRGSPVQAEASSAIHSRYGAGWRAHGQEQLVSTAIDRNYYKGPDKHGQRTVIGIKLANTSRYRQGVKRTPLKKLEKIGNIAKSGHDSIWGRVYDPEGISMNLNAEGGGLGAKTGLYAIRQTNPSEPKIKFIGGLDGGSDRIGDSKKLSRNYAQGKRVHSADGIAPSLPASPVGSEGGNTGLFAVGPVVLADRTRSYANLGRNLESPKLITNALSGVQKDNLILENLKIRRLTPVECERLQGFPDGWTEWGIDENGEKVKISDTQRYKMLGNAVTTNVITFLGRRIMEAESNG